MQEVNGSKAIGYTYNANGDLANKTTGEQYSYDIQGNLVSIVGNGIDKQYTYHGNGNRISETTDGETIFYVNDLNRRYEEVLQTYDKDGNVINTYTYGVDRIQSVGQNNETYLYDGRGSVVGSVSDNLMTSYAYTAYGELMSSSLTPNVYGYNGEQTDFVTGQQYLRARYYDTTVQRFVNEDAWRGNYRSPKSQNRYSYTFNNPVMYADDGGNRPVELTEVNTHTMQQVKQTTHNDLMKEYQQKKQEAIARSQDNELRRIQQMKQDNIERSRYLQPVDSNGVPTSINLNNAAKVIEKYNCGLPQEYQPTGPWDAFLYSMETAWTESIAGLKISGQTIADGFKEAGKGIKEQYDVMIDGFGIVGESLIEAKNGIKKDFEVMGEAFVQVWEELKVGAVAVKDFVESISNFENVHHPIALDEKIINGAINTLLSGNVSRIGDKILTEAARPITAEEAQEYYDEYKEEFGEGIYFEDIAVSGGKKGVFVSAGVTIVINLDEGFVGQYGHGGSGLGVSYPSTTIQIITGKITDGTFEYKYDYEAAFIDLNMGAILARSYAAGLPLQDMFNPEVMEDVIKQDGGGIITGFAYSEGVSWYEVYAFHDDLDNN